MSNASLRISREGGTQALTAGIAHFQATPRGTLIHLSLVQTGMGSQANY